MPPSSTYHSSDGPAYQRFLGRWTRRLAHELTVFAGLPAEGAFLDAGTGTGSLALELAQGFPRRTVIGIDISQIYVDFAATLSSLGNIHFEVGDASSLRFADATFAGGLSQLVLTFIPSYDAASRELRRVVRPGGIAAAAVWDFRGGLVYQRLFWDTVVGIDAGAAAARDRLFSHPLSVAGGLAALWKRAGFIEVENASLTIRMDFADFADYWEPLLGGQGPVGVYVGGLSAAKLAEIRERVRDAYLSGAGDGPRSMTATAWAVRGRVPPA